VHQRVIVIDVFVHAGKARIVVVKQASLLERFVHAGTNQSLGHMARAPAGSVTQDLKRLDAAVGDRGFEPWSSEVRAKPLN
jgi:hypothetical protein